VHAAVPVAVRAAAGHDFTVTDLPAVPRAATVVHRGSMDAVLSTEQLLARWIDAHGHRAAGFARELYLECEGERDTWVTELQTPLMER
jgi:effector-binding domain-containing protein